jgi:hypothetical protein
MSIDEQKAAGKSANRFFVFSLRFYLDTGRTVSP